MKQLRVTNIQRGCVYDGPGVRTTVFLKGCPLRCPWCCNPETQTFDEEYFVDNEKCLFYKGEQSTQCVNCVRRGGTESINRCLFGVCEKTCKDYEYMELLDVLSHDISLYQLSDGGVTFSGGEPLMQTEPLSHLIEVLHLKGINVAIETSFYSNTINVRKLNPFVDCWIVDLKLQPQTKLDNKEYFEIIYNNYLEIRGKNLINRLVFVNEVNMCREKVVQKLRELGVNNVELILCHNLGKRKYEKLQKDYHYINASKDEAIVFVDYLKKNNIETTLLTV